VYCTVLLFFSPQGTSSSQEMDGIFNSNLEACTRSVQSKVTWGDIVTSERTGWQSLTNFEMTTLASRLSWSLKSLYSVMYYRWCFHSQSISRPCQDGIIPYQAHWTAIATVPYDTVASRRTDICQFPAPRYRTCITGNASSGRVAKLSVYPTNGVETLKCWQDFMKKASWIATTCRCTSPGHEISPGCQQICCLPLFLPWWNCRAIPILLVLYSTVLYCTMSIASIQQQVELITIQYSPRLRILYLIAISPEQ
jgi:hypothetical protein